MNEYFFRPFRLGAESIVVLYAHEVYKFLILIQLTQVGLIFSTPTEMLNIGLMMGRVQNYQENKRFDCDASLNSLKHGYCSILTKSCGYQIRFHPVSCTWNFSLHLFAKLWIDGEIFNQSCNMK